jgi:hypothetical protein
MCYKTNKMAEITTNLSTVTLIVKSINSPIKRHRLKNKTQPFVVYKKKKYLERQT